MEQNWKSKVKQISKDTCTKIESILTERQFLKLQYISEGGQALLLRAYSIIYQKDVALKISKDVQDTYELIQEEYKIIQGIKHSTNIITFYDCLFFQDHLITILVQELCEKSLLDEMKDLIKNQQWYTEEEMISIIMQICHALTQIHSHKIIHFDIKPENILKSFDGTYKLCDFGLAKQIQKDKSYTQNQLGYSPKYMSQERYKKSGGYDIKLNCLTDVYSAGLLFLEILEFQMTDMNAMYLRDNQMNEIDDIKEFKYQDALKVINDKMLCADCEKRIPSYKLMNELIKCLPFTQNNLMNLLNEIEYVERIELFDNNINIPYVLNIKLYYLLTKSFIYDHLSYTPPHQDKAKLFTNLAWVYYEQGNFQLAVDNFEQSIQFYKMILPQGYQDIVYSLNSICHCYSKLQNHQKSLQSGLEALHFAKSIQPKNNYTIAKIAQTQKEVSWAYMRLNNNKKALEFAEESLLTIRLINKNQPNEDQASILNVIGGIHQQMGNTDLVLYYTQQALDIYQKLYDKQIHPNIANLLFNLGIFYENTQDFAQSLSYFEQSLQMRKVLFHNNHVNVLLSLKKYCDVSRKLGNVKQVKVLEQEIQKIQENQLKEGITYPF